MRTRVRVRSFVLLLALLGVQLVTLGAAFAGAPACLCDENKCTHHPKGHGSHDHGSHGHDSHVAAAPIAQQPATPSADHCAYQAALIDTGNCSMRGCDHKGEDSLPVTTLASLPYPTSIARPEGVSVLASGAIGSPLDRSPLIELPPPRLLSV